MAPTRRAYASASLLTLVSVLSISGRADAQEPEADTDAAAASAEVEAIVVTGSRIARRDYNAESPVVTVSRDIIDAAGPTPVEATLAQLPQFVPGNTGTSGQLRGSGQGTVDLRGLGVPRTLVLLDGRRLQPSSSTNAVDVTTIPSALLSGVEIITGGASSTYGSDAIAGVVNFKLNRRFEGVQAEAQYGISDQGDNETWNLGLTIGGAFAEDRGHAVFSVGYNERPIVFTTDRAFFDDITTASATIPQGLLPASTNQPTQAAVDAIFARYGVAPGTVSRTSSFGFNDDGTLFATGRGVTNYRGPGFEGGFVVSPAAVGFSGTDNFLQSPQKRGSFFGLTSYQLTDTIRGELQLTYTAYDTRTQLAAAPGDATAGLSIPVTNPFISADLRQLLASRPNPTARFPFEKRTLYAGARRTDVTYNVGQVLLGLTGALPIKDWTWDSHISYGVTDEKRAYRGWTSLSATQQLLDAPDGGASICAGGFNPFGLAVPSAACMAYLTRNPKDTSRFTQTDAELNFQGGLIEAWAGEVRYAAGVAARRNFFEFEPDPLNVSGDLVAPNTSSPTKGSTSVKEAYLELLVPVLKDLPFAEAVDLNGGVRISDYRGVGSVTTYKLTSNWMVNDFVTLRGGFARAIRAPSVGELFAPAAKTAPGIGMASQGTGDPCDIRGRLRTGGNAAQVRALCIAQGVPAALIDNFVYNIATAPATSVGNPDLEPETADTLSFGVVLRSPIQSGPLSSITASIDYYDIKVDDAIGPLSIATSLQECFNTTGNNPAYDASNVYCQQVVRDAGTGVITVLSRQPTFNLAAFKTSGIDFQIDGRADLADLGLPDVGRISVNAVATYVDSFKTQNFSTQPFQESAGFQGKPTWKAVLTTRYDNGPFQGTVRFRYIDAMTAAARVTNPLSTTPGTDPAYYVDLEAKYDLSKAVELRAGLTNAFDAEPEVTGGQPGTTDATLYDVLGRRFFFGVRAKF